jgi:hypothetical protein
MKSRLPKPIEAEERKEYACIEPCKNRNKILKDLFLYSTDLLEDSQGNKLFLLKQGRSKHWHACHDLCFRGALFHRNNLM